MQANIGQDEEVIGKSQLSNKRRDYKIASILKDTNHPENTRAWAMKKFKMTTPTFIFNKVHCEFK